MLNRIFKTILVLSICIGVSFPTNAAVSVSDGSAFVTKAEFAADLNNLSNRMAQLENSLDAKIDSLVSSYLTRNGIWNGAKQIASKEYICDMFGLQISDYTESYTGKLPKITQAGVEMVMYDKTYSLVDSINKSGLMLAIVNVIDQGRIYASTQSDKRAALNIGSIDSYKNIAFVDTGETSFYIDSVNKGKVDSFSWNTCLFNDYLTLQYQLKTGTYNVYFFVSKGDRLDFRYKIGFVGMTEGGRDALSEKSYTRMGTPGIKIKFTDFYVY